MDCSLPNSSVHGILQARILKWGAIPFSRGSSRPRDRTLVSHITGGFFTIWATREAPCPWKPGSKWGCAFLADCSHLQNQSRNQTGNDFPCLWWSSTIGTGYKLEILRGSPGGSDCKQFTCQVQERQETRGLIPGLGRSTGGGTATHSSILAWRIPWTEEPGRLQSMGLHRVGHDWATNTFTFTWKY